MLQWYRSLHAWELFGISVAAAILLQWVLTHVVLRFTRRTATDLDEKFVLSIRFPIFVTLLFVGAVLALRRLDPPLQPRTLFLTRAVLTTVAALLWMRALRRVGDAVCDVLARRVDDFRWIQPRSLPLYEILHALVIFGVGIYVILIAWKIDLTAWLASAGIIGIAVGFAARDTLANLFAGIFILADAPYRLGDFIILAGGERGRVTDIGIRSTRLLTREDIEITIPNSVIANGKIVNETGGPHSKRRVRISVGVAYGSDIDKVRAALLAVAEESGLSAGHPSPRVRFRRFGDSSLDFDLLVWIEEPVFRGRAVDQLNTAVYKRFLADRIEIPFPQRDVHLHPAPED